MESDFNIQKHDKLDISNLNDEETVSFLHRKTYINDNKKIEDEEKLKKIEIIFKKESKIKINAEYFNIFYYLRVTKKIALDCEMVEINKLQNGLARISVVNEHGEILINTLCKPPGLITNFRKDITGLSERDLEQAIDFEECRKNVKILFIKTKVIKLFKNKVIIGHSIQNDLLALNYEHPKNLIRDTSKFRKFRNKSNQAHSLKYLCKIHLDKEIQNSVHDSIEDARATLCLYKLYEDEIEKDKLNKNHKLIRKKVLEDSKKMHKLFGI